MNFTAIYPSGLPQYEATKSYMPKEPDELGLKEAELVIVLQKQEGWCYGERMRDGVRGWFPNSCATEITNPEAIESNVQRMRRLRKETNVWETALLMNLTKHKLSIIVNVVQQSITNSLKNIY